MSLELAPWHLSAMPPQIQERLREREVRQPLGINALLADGAMGGLSQFQRLQKSVILFTILYPQNGMD